MAAVPAVRRHFVDGTFGQLHCRRSAPADPVAASVVCLHMSPKSGRSFHRLLPLLAAERIALAPDNPGHGESDLPPAEPRVTIADYAHCVWQCVDALATSPVHFIGFHTGAMVAVEAHRQRPGRVLSIVSISAPLFTADELAALRASFQPLPIDEEGSRFRIMWERILRHRGPGMTLKMAADSLAENLRAGDHYEWGHRAAFDYADTYRERLAAIEVPMLVLNPADDLSEQTRRVDPLLRNGRRLECPQWGHGFLEAHSVAAAAVMNRFIARVEAGERDPAS